MTDNHPITPPPELVYQWVENAIGPDYEQVIATQAAQWGANQELEACCEWVSQWRCMVGGNRPEVGLRAARRSKPLSLAEEALMGLERTVIMLMPVTGRKKIKRFDIIRRALERLKELEQLND